METEELRADLAGELHGWERRLFAKPPGVDPELGRKCLSTCDGLRELAVVSLLAVDGKFGFDDYLGQSARLWTRFLKSCRESGASEDPHYVASRYEPLLDSIAAGDRGAASAIVKETPRAFRGGFDHPEDFAYARIVGAIASEADESVTRDAVAALREAATSSEAVSRADVCLAIATRDVARFAVAFGAVQDRHAERVGPWSGWERREFQLRAAMLDESRDAEACDDLRRELRAAARQVSIEHLALLHLASSRRMPVSREYRYCPAEALGEEIP